VPEGDTIYRVATTLSRVLAGERVVRAASSVAGIDAATLVGRVVTTVEAKGKNVLVRFDDGRVLHTHLRMGGAWHVYRPGEKWKAQASAARLVLETEKFVAVCFRAPVVALLTERGEKRSPMLATLGPDLAKDEFDAPLAVARLRRLEDEPIGVALMRQSALAGIGNVYKSEVLFVCRVDPFAKVSALDDATLSQLVATARELLRKNLGGGARVTTSGRLAERSAVHVYGRAGEPCFACGTAIALRRQGTLGRTTYYCPRCQRVSLTAAAPARGSRRRRARP
jgi:endonuclease-8